MCLVYVHKQNYKLFPNIQLIYTLAFCANRLKACANISMGKWGVTCKNRSLLRRLLCREKSCQIAALGSRNVPICAHIAYVLSPRSLHHRALDASLSASPTSPWKKVRGFITCEFRGFPHDINFSNESWPFARPRLPGSVNIPTRSRPRRSEEISRTCNFARCETHRETIAIVSFARCDSDSSEYSLRRLRSVHSTVEDLLTKRPNSPKNLWNAIFHSVWKSTQEICVFFLPQKLRKKGHHINLEL